MWVYRLFFYSDDNKITIDNKDNTPSWRLKVQNKSWRCKSGYAI